MHPKFCFGISMLARKQVKSAKNARTRGFDLKFYALVTSSRTESVAKFFKIPLCKAFPEVHKVQYLKNLG